mmetsp:Transcript_41312/g.73279  ORF Transcript_41312/g.73279 Transcript_41312/m.73279 type:complete len:142 (+) Transcript_41312:3-428(+)
MQVSDRGLASLAQGLPPTLRHLSVRASSCKGVGDSGAAALANALPRGLETLQVDLSWCHQVSNAAVMAFAHGLPESVQVLDFNCQNTGISNAEFSLHTSPDTLRALRSQGQRVNVDAAQPFSPPDLKKYLILPAEPAVFVA